jgi:hypothetical protein
LTGLDLSVLQIKTKIVIQLIPNWRSMVQSYFSLKYSLPRLTNFGKHTDMAGDGSKLWVLFAKPP